MAKKKEESKTTVKIARIDNVRPRPREFYYDEFGKGWDAKWTKLKEGKSVEVTTGLSVSAFSKKYPEFELIGGDDLETILTE